MERKRLQPWHGIVSFVVMMVIFFVIAVPVQGNLGLIGVGITELLLLVLAIGAAVLFKQNLKEVFPIKVPKVREVFGVLVFCMGGFLLAIMASASIAVLFPEMIAVSEGLSDVITSEDMWLRILIVSVLPAICEEAMHRGFILHTFKDVKKPWVIVVSMAVIFGVFHLDVYRFLPTAILGGCITWVMLKTDNMLMPSLYHATNNLVPILVSSAMQGVTEAAMTAVEAQDATTVTAIMESGAVASVSAIGVYLMLSVVALPLMLAGTALMKKKGEKIAGKHIVAVLVTAGVLFFTGLVMVIGASVYLVASQGLGM